MTPMAAPALAAALFAIDPAGLGGVVLRAGHGPRRDRWLALLAELLPAGTPLRRVPLHAGDDRLLGGLDLAATLQAGRPVAQRGLLAEADGGVVVLAMAERMSLAVAARMAAALDSGAIVLEREGITLRLPARIGVVALDEGIGDEEGLAPRLMDRLAFHLALDEGADVSEAPACGAADVAAARALLPEVEVAAELVEALCAAALALGVPSMRAALLAVAAARASAALHGRRAADEKDAALAARLVLSPRATQRPAAAEPADESPDESPAKDATADPPQTPPPPSPDANSESNEADTPVSASRTEDVVLEAALAALPPGLLAALKAGELHRPTAPAAGRMGALQASRLRGRPSGVRRSEPRGGARLNLMQTLRAAAPWQRLRRLEAPDAGARVLVRRDDFHITRFKQRSETTTLFVVDASGSAALHRLAETKGAVELLLADCYVRRDSVAVLAFRGAGAELLLPPTRSLVRAKRCLDGLPGGGGTPLAAGIDAALALCEGLRRKCSLPVVVLLTDGRANVARDGSPGRARAAEDALAAARQMRTACFTTLWLDTSPQPHEAARVLAREMGSSYLPLPHADAMLLSQAVRMATAAC
jgi:magnesium chelatase subunit D